MTRRAPLMVLVVMLGIRSAHAQQPAAGDVATANALFVEGRRLSADGRFAEACARFEASMALVPRLGVQLNLADCYEHLGKTASAWVTFGEAAALARRIADRREGFARQRQDALVPRLSHLSITLSSAPIDGLAVMRDGVRVAPSAYGVQVPVDPGVHTVEVTAPERVPWSTRVVVSGEGAISAVAIPELARRPGSPATAPAEPTAAPGRRRPTPATWIALGTGAVGIGVGTALGIAARSLWQEARVGCDPSNVCTNAAYALVERSRRDGNFSTAAFAIGGAALVTGVVLYLWAPRDRARPVRVIPELAPGAAGLAVVGVL